ncbi:hypothetical protein TWF694_010541 [Orbilia ellipsospora]|uniref:Fucose-specific lectin n=1 Tax=Orbilia ellipsospora TaxID=2528407 RepID=A0AAV9XAQ1_9PEZI
MTSTLQGNLARHFANIAWSAMPPSSGSKDEFYLNAEDSDIVEQVWDGAQFGIETTVAEDAMDETAVAYIKLPGKRAVVYVTEAGKLGQAVCNDKSLEWEPKPIFGSDVDIGPQGQFATISSPDGPTLFYQDKSGDVCSIESTTSFGGAEPQFLTSDAILGSPLHISLLGEDLFIFYVHNDGRIHFQSLQDEKSEDQIWEGSFFENASSIRKITLLRNGSGHLDTPPDLYCLTKGDEVYRVTLGGEKSKIGTGAVVSATTATAVVLGGTYGPLDH